MTTTKLPACRLTSHLIDLRAQEFPFGFTCLEVNIGLVETTSLASASLSSIGGKFQFDSGNPYIFSQAYFAWGRHHHHVQQSRRNAAHPSEQQCYRDTSSAHRHHCSDHPQGTTIEAKTKEERPHDFRVPLHKYRKHQHADQYAREDADHLPFIRKAICLAASLNGPASGSCSPGTNSTRTAL